MAYEATKVAVRGTKQMDTFDTRIIEIADFKSLIKSYPRYILWRLNAT